MPEWKNEHAKIKGTYHVVPAEQYTLRLDRKSPRGWNAFSNGILDHEGGLLH